MCTPGFVSVLYGGLVYVIVIVKLRNVFHLAHFVQNKRFGGFSTVSPFFVH